MSIKQVTEAEFEQEFGFTVDEWQSRLDQVFNLSNHKLRYQVVESGERLNIVSENGHRVRYSFDPVTCPEMESDSLTDLPYCHVGIANNEWEKEALADFKEIVDNTPDAIKEKRNIDRELARREVTALFKQCNAVGKMFGKQLVNKKGKVDPRVQKMWNYAFHLRDKYRDRGLLNTPIPANKLKDYASKGVFVFVAISDARQLATTQCEKGLRCHIARNPMRGDYWLFINDPSKAWESTPKDYSTIVETWRPVLKHSGVKNIELDPTKEYKIRHCFPKDHEIRKWVSDVTNAIKQGEEPPKWVNKTEKNTSKYGASCEVAPFSEMNRGIHSSEYTGTAVYVGKLTKKIVALYGIGDTTVASYMDKPPSKKGYPQKKVTKKFKVETYPELPNVDGKRFVDVTQKPKITYEERSVWVDDTSKPKVETVAGIHYGLHGRWLLDFSKISKGSSWFSLRAPSESLALKEFKASHPSLTDYMVYPVKDSREVYLDNEGGDYTPIGAFQEDPDAGETPPTFMGFDDENAYYAKLDATWQNIY